MYIVIRLATSSLGEARTRNSPKLQLADPLCNVRDVQFRKVSDPQLSDFFSWRIPVYIVILLATPSFGGPPCVLQYYSRHPL